MQPLTKRSHRNLVNGAAVKHATGPQFGAESGQGVDEFW